MTKSLVLLPVLSLAACVPHAAPAAARASAPAVAPARAVELPWIEDDWAKAIAEGKRLGRPIVVDLWAPWCHYCTAAEGTTLRDPAVTGMKDRFVWARVNTDDPKNGDVLERLRVQGLPDYLILDPADESIVGRWLGSATAEQFRNALRDAERVYQSAHAGTLSPDDPLRLLVDANVASKKGDHPHAADTLAKALRVAPAGWDRRDDTTDMLVSELLEANRAQEAIDVALAIPDSDRTSAAADAIGTAVEGLDALPKDTRNASSLQAKLLARIESLAKDSAAPLDTDVRVALWDSIHELRKAGGDEKGAKEATREGLALLDAAARRAPDALAASAYNSGRAHDLMLLDRPDDAIALLKKSESELPHEPDPPARLARVYMTLHRDADALPEIDKAIANAPKKFAVELMLTRAAILAGLHRTADVCTTLKSTLADEGALPESQRDEDVEATARAQMEKAGCPAGS